MSWPAAAFALLALALAGGFAWYERARPTTRTVALVATLAALGALGRIAFAPLPNVKPTTDIVLIAGFVLGGPPGFVVGAVSALASNFFFGQGPWTPWQMAGWGLVGLSGAGLAVVCRGRMPRWALAVVCAVVGFAFTAVQDFGDWVTYSDHSAGQLAAYFGKGVGFDLVHAGGCVAFALLFGPGLIGALSRFERRTSFTWSVPGEGLALLLPCLVLALGGAVSADRAVAASGGLRPAHASRVGSGGAAAVSRAEGYLRRAENGDGGFGATPGEASSALFTGWAAMGLAAGGAPPSRSTAAYLLAHASAGEDAGSLERDILALRALGRPPPGSLVRALRGRLGGNGSVSGQVNLTAFAILTLRAAGVPVPERAESWLARQQNADGGFGFQARPSASDVDDTGAALEALGPRARGPRLAAALRFLRAQQNRDGGLPSQIGGDSDAQSTAFAIQGLLAAGVDPSRLRARSGANPPGYLRARIAPDGHVSYAAGADQTPVWVTAQALMALAGRPLPVLTPLDVVRPAPAGPARPGSSRRRGSAGARGSAGRRPARARSRRRPPARGSIGKGGEAPARELAAGAGALMALALAPAGL